MIRECFKTKTGIIFDSQGLRDLGLDLSTLDPCNLGRHPPGPLPVLDATIRSIPPPPPKGSQKSPSPSPSPSPSRKPTSLIKRFKLLFTRVEERQHSYPHTHPAAVDGPSIEELKTEEMKVEEIPIGSEEEEELKDALSPIYDRLKLVRAWWILEFFPSVKVRYQQDDTSRGKKVMCVSLIS